MGDKKTVLVTGAAQGIGACIAEILAFEGYDIIMTDIVSKEKAESVITSCEKNGAEVLFMQSDVSSFDSCGQAVREAMEKFGSIYALVNNAGVTRDFLLMRMSEQQFDMVMDINLKGVFNMSKHVLPHMVKAREGRIVSISSVSGIYGNAGQTNYASSKAGIIGFTKSLASEIGSRNITVNAVAPGYIATEMTASLPDGAAEKIKSRISLGRLGTPRDVADAVSFLISDKASYISGHVLSVDGGMSI